MKTIIVDNKNDGKNLNNVILSEFKSLSVNSLYKALRKKDIKINGTRTNSNIIVHENDRIDIYILDELLFGNKTFTNTKLWINENIIFEDKNIIAINKPNQIEVLRPTFFN